MAIGKSGTAGGNDSTTSLNRPAGLDFDATGSEVFVADGYVNRRVIVFDAATGAYKRHWGAYGAAPGDNPGAYDPAAPPAKQFRTVTCASVAKDGTVYVCDRNSNRIQVFAKDGKFVKEAVIAPATLGSGAVWDIAFSADPQQQLLFVADGQNQRVTVLVRDSLQELAKVGSGGRYPGQFYGVSSVAVDSRGNLYTGEGLEGKRLQKWNVKRNDQHTQPSRRLGVRRRDRRAQLHRRPRSIRRRRRAWCRRRSSRSIRRGRSRFPTTGCSAMRSACGPTRRTTSGSCIAATPSAPTKAQPSENPPTAECCSPRAAGSQIQPGRRRRRLLGRPGDGYDWPDVESRHLRRSQRLRVDRRQRRHRRPRPEVHAGRQVHRPVRQAGAKQGQQRHRELQPRRRRSSSIRRRTRPTSPMATATAASR